MAVCSKCGTMVADDSKFCSTCGQAIEISEVQVTAAETEPAMSETPVQTYYAPPQTEAPLQGNYVPPQDQTPQQNYNAPPPAQAPEQSYYAPPQGQAPGQNYYAPPQGQNPQQSYYAPPQGQNPQQGYAQQQPQSPPPNYYAQQPNNNGYQQNYQQTGPSYPPSQADVEENKGISVLCYLGILLLIPLLTKPNSGYVKYHSNQGLILLILGVVIGILARIPYLGYYIIGPFGSLFVLVCVVIGIINTVNGHMKPLPLIGNFTLLK